VGAPEAFPAVQPIARDFSMPRQIQIQEIEQFTFVARVPTGAISSQVLDGVRNLHEKDSLEPAVREILYDPNETPHGPTEIADIYTSRVTVGGQPRVAAFVLKGRSFRRVSAREVTHQFVRLRRVPDLGLMVFMAVGDIQDDARSDFIQTAQDAGCDYLIIDATDIARLLIAYGKLCAQDGTPYDDTGLCAAGHPRDPEIILSYRVNEDPRYEITNLSEVSHAGAKRYSASIVVDRHYPRDILREIIRAATTEVRTSDYYRNERVEAHWGETPAHVVWLYLAYDLEDLRRKNWVCRSEWIDPALDSRWRPTGMKGDERVEDIEVTWNPNYDWMKDFMRSRSASKGAVLARLRPILKRMIELGDAAIVLFASYVHGELSDGKFSHTMQTLRPEVNELYSRSGDLPNPPDDVKDYDQICHSLFADVDNLYLPFSEQGRTTWTTSQRDALLALGIKTYMKNKERLKYEEEKLH
jgi:hypothetical protein